MPARAARVALRAVNVDGAEQSPWADLFRTAPAPVGSERPERLRVHPRAGSGRGIAGMSP
jgi:hypothetical protein